MKLAAVPSAMATVLAALLIVAPVLVGCSRNGQGTYTYANRNTYTGAFKDGMANGQGTLTFAHGTTYTGEFKDDMFNGQGTYTSANGYTFTGEWKDRELVP